MKGVLKWHQVMGADYPELEELGLAFAARCNPPFTKEAKGLLDWVRNVIENHAEREPQEEIPETPEEEPEPEPEKEPIKEPINVDAPLGLAGLLTEILRLRGAPESGCGGKLEDQVVSWIREKPEYTTWLRRSAHLHGRQLGLSLDSWLSPEYQQKMDERVEDRGRRVQRQIATRDRTLRKYKRSLLRAGLKEVARVMQAYQRRAEEAVQKGEARAGRVKGEKAKAKRRTYAKEVADRILRRGKLRAVKVRLKGEEHALQKFRRLKGETAPQYQWGEGRGSQYSYCGAVWNQTLDSYLNWQPWEAEIIDSVRSGDWVFEDPKRPRYENTTFCLTKAGTRQECQHGDKNAVARPCGDPHCERCLPRNAFWLRQSTQQPGWRGLVPPTQLLDWAISPKADPVHALLLVWTLTQPSGLLWRVYGPTATLLSVERCVPLVDLDTEKLDRALAQVRDAIKRHGEDLDQYTRNDDRAIPIQSATRLYEDGATVRIVDWFLTSGSVGAGRRKGMIAHETGPISYK
jgi:hypothetical protein